MRGAPAYGLLGAPMAMAALPVYIHAPKLYGDQLGLGLGVTGTVLFLSRLVDTAQDPWLGRLTDWTSRYTNGWRWLVTGSSGLLIAAYFALFNPPVLHGEALGWWLCLSLILVYTAHSAINITYLAWVAGVKTGARGRMRLVAWREGFALSGVMLASVLPTLLVQSQGLKDGWFLFSVLFAAILIAASWILLNLAPQPALVARHGLSKANMLQPLRLQTYRRLLLLFLLNGLAMAVAATLSLFYIDDVLGAESIAGYFLALYFVSAGLSLPFWMRVSQSLGRPETWLVGSLLAVAAFIWASFLEVGDLLPYGLICLVSGAAFGADLAMPASLSAELVSQQEKQVSGSYFGIWSFTGKLVLALAASISMPMLELLDYRPSSGQGLETLIFFYAVIPCLIKVLTVALLWRWRHSLEASRAQ